MKNNIMFPDYNKSILNLTVSILKHYRVKSEFNSLKIIDSILEKRYKNVVLVVLDGMGNDILNKLSPEGIFNKNKISVLTSVFPPTTAAAMTTYYSAKLPIQTGWIGWSQYFKEYGRTIDVLTSEDSYTEEKFSCPNLEVRDILKYKTIFEQIQEKGFSTYELAPNSCITDGIQKSIGINSISEMCENIVKLCKKSEEKFILAYFDNPDGLIHMNGCYSNVVKEFINETEKKFKDMYNSLNSTNTLVIISADHGHNDINEIYNMIDLNDLNQYLIMPPFLESRFLSFFVKRDKTKLFEEKFKTKFKDKFLLYSKDEFFKSHLLGIGEMHYKIDDFIGDYVAVAISDSIIKLGTRISIQKKDKCSTHSGLTRNEMEVPLIVFDLK